MSVVVNGVQQHLVSYYNKDDVLANRFQTPTDTPELASIEISTELLCGQNFRIPFFLGDDSQSANSFGEKKGVTIKRSATERTTTKQKRPSSPYNHQLSRRRYSNNIISNISTPPASIKSVGSSSSSSYSSDLMQEEYPYSTTPNSYDSSPVPFSVNNPIHLLTDTPRTSTNSVYSSPSCDQYQQQQDVLSSQVPHSTDCFYLPPPLITNRHESTGNQSMKRQLSQQTNFTKEHYSLYDCQATNVPRATKSTSIIPESVSYHSHYHKQQHHSISPTTTALSGVGSEPHPQHWLPHSFSTGYSNERHEQNPHQHLFSSTSLHSINHAAIPTRTTELISNAFMLDTNALLGSGWNDFEMQM
ncbi:unnamed protein product [Absidia cylindrospora]